MLRSSSLPTTRKKTSYINRTRNELLGSSKRLAPDRSPSVRRLLQLQELDPVSKSRKKTNDTASDVAATAFLRSTKDDVVEDDEYAEFAKNFGDDDNKSMWLSSGTLSPSSCFSDRRFSVILDPSLDEWLVSFRNDDHMIKTSGSRTSFDLESNGLWVSSEIVEFSGSGLLGSPSEYVPEDFDLSDTEADDEPLFWPSDKKCDWCSAESKWDFFIMSPRKIARKNENSTPAELIHLRNYESSKEEGYSRRKILLSSGSKSSKVLKMKPTRANGAKELKRTKTMPSRLGNPNHPKSSVKIVSLDDEVKEEKMFVEAQKKSSIEMLMGLDEFDGHEGIDSGFNKDYFSFDESL